MPAVTGKVDWCLQSKQSGRDWVDVQLMRLRYHQSGMEPWTNGHQKRGHVLHIIRISVHAAQVGPRTATASKYPGRRRLNNDLANCRMIHVVALCKRVGGHAPIPTIGEFIQLPRQCREICLWISLIIGHPGAAVHALEALWAGKVIGVDKGLGVHLGHTVI